MMKAAERSDGRVKGPVLLRIGVRAVRLGLPISRLGPKRNLSHSRANNCINSEDAVGNPQHSVLGSDKRAGGPRRSVSLVIAADRNRTCLLRSIKRQSAIDAPGIFH